MFTPSEGGASGKPYLVCGNILGFEGESAELATDIELSAVQDFSSINVSPDSVTERSVNDFEVTLGLSEIEVLKESLVEITLGGNWNEGDMTWVEIEGEKRELGGSCRREESYLYVCDSFEENFTDVWYINFYRVQAPAVNDQYTTVLID